MAKRADAKASGSPANAAAGGHAGATKAAPKAAKAATPWGDASVVEEVKVAQRAGDRRFSSIVQLLEDGRGEPLVRIAYTTDGVARRGPVTLRAQDLEKLRAAVLPGSRLAAALGWPGGEA